MKHKIEEVGGKNSIRVGTAKKFLKCSMGAEDIWARENLKRVIEPWLSATLQTDHLAMLIGAGFAAAICQITSVNPSPMGTVNFGKFDEKINTYAEKAAARLGRGKYNIEDQLRIAISLLQGYEVDGEEDNSKDLRGCIDNVLSEFLGNILSSECNLFRTVRSDNNQTTFKAIAMLESFLLTFADRNAARRWTYIFTTNYDRMIGYGCDLVGIKILDHSWGKIIPKFEESPSGIDYYYRTLDAKNEFRFAEGVICYTKIHDSVDWYEEGGVVHRDALRFSTEKVRLPTGDSYKDHLIIYPNSMKSVETTFYPYAELFKDFSSAICRPNSTLVTYGYGFGDTHMNKIIEKILHTPSAHIVIIAHNVDTRLETFLKQINMAQVASLAGEEFASLKNLVSYYLPKVAINTLTETTSKSVKARRGYMESGEGGENNNDAEL